MKLSTKYDPPQNGIVFDGYTTIYTGGGTSVTIDFDTHGSGYFSIDNVILYLVEGRTSVSPYQHTGAPNIGGYHRIWSANATWNGAFGISGGWTITKITEKSNSTNSIGRISKINIL